MTLLDEIITHLTEHPRSSVRSLETNIGVHRIDIEAGLSELVAQHIVVAENSGGGVTYSMAPDIRIAWQISDKGDWHPSKERTALQAVVSVMNEMYGDETHWIEEMKA